MRVLIACEESQRVCNEFRKKGHESYSCDILPTSGNHPEWHIQGDVRDIINYKWDMIIAFPPCTHLAVSGARHFEKKREDGRQLEGILLFYDMINASCDRICVENPVNIISGDYIKKWFNIEPLKPTQIIQPYEYGEPYRKKTCLWLKGLEPLKPTNIVEPNIVTYTRKDGRITTFSADYGIAKAMAEQWG